jgi:hypothetical protein
VIAVYCSCEQAEKAKTQAREAVVLLEQARMLLREDNAVQLAMQHTDEAIREADTRAAMLEDWYRRTYSPQRIPLLINQVNTQGREGTLPVVPRE